MIANGEMVSIDQEVAVACIMILYLDIHLEELKNVENHMDKLAGGLSGI
jgi:hypothetical protein